MVFLGFLSQASCLSSQTGSHMSLAMGLSTLCLWSCVIFQPGTVGRVARLGYGKSLVPKQCIPHTADFLSLSVAPRVGSHMDFEGFGGRSWIETVRQRPQSETGACRPRNEHNSTGIQSRTPATLPPTPAKGVGCMGTLVKPWRGCPWEQFVLKFGPQLSCQSLYLQHLQEAAV